MKLFPALAIALALAGCDQTRDVQRAAYCHLYPSQCRPVRLPPERPVAGEPAPPVVLPEEPAHLPPSAVEQPAALPEPQPAPPVIVEEETKPAPISRRPSPSRERAKKAKPKPPVKGKSVRRPTPGESISCALVRKHAAGKSKAELDALDAAYGWMITTAQRRQARACLGH